MTKANVKPLAIKLRESGHSYNYIAQNIGVSKSTLSEWLAEVPYTPNQMTLNRIGNARAQSGLVKSNLKRDSIERARILARKDVGKLTKRDLFMLGLGLYIGEGGKSLNLVRVVNANPRVIRSIIRWFEETCSLSKDNFALRIHLYPDNDIQACHRFWSSETGIPLSNFQECQVDRRLDKRLVKKGKLPFGTAHLTVRSNGKKEFGVFLARRIAGWMDEAMAQACE